MPEGTAGVRKRTPAAITISGQRREECNQSTCDWCLQSKILGLLSSAGRKSGGIEALTKRFESLAITIICHSHCASTLCARNFA